MDGIAEKGQRGVSSKKFWPLGAEKRPTTHSPTQFGAGLRGDDGFNSLGDRETERPTIEHRYEEDELERERRALRI
jgi:hypothetical protein